jgi:hypothetical protein
MEQFFDFDWDMSRSQANLSPSRGQDRTATVLVTSNAAGWVIWRKLWPDRSVNEFGNDATYVAARYLHQKTGTSICT